MNIEDFRDYCLAKEYVTEGFPFNETTLVFKVCGKMFALCGIDPFEYTNLKCDPERAIELREKYSAVKPGYHMSKVHWNSVYFQQDLPHKEILKLVDNSYDLVLDSVSKKQQQKWKDQNPTT
jgi:predicted DNA-binding protein (MmcQ/YjbR family)